MVLFRRRACSGRIRARENFASLHLPSLKSGRERRHFPFHVAAMVLWKPRPQRALFTTRRFNTQQSVSLAGVGSALKLRRGNPRGKCDKGFNFSERISYLPVADGPPRCHNAGIPVHFPVVLATRSGANALNARVGGDRGGEAQGSEPESQSVMESSPR